MPTHLARRSRLFTAYPSRRDDPRTRNAGKFLNSKDRGICPNPLNARSKGDLPVAFIGTAALDGTTIDAASVRLLDVAPFRSSLEDVATPFQPFIGKSVASDCTDQGSDGLTDLILKFDKQEVLQAIETALGRQVRDREVLVLTLTGNLKDGTPILGEDVVLILNKGGS